MQPARVTCELVFQYLGEFHLRSPPSHLPTLSCMDLHDCFQIVADFLLRVFLLLCPRDAQRI